MSDIPVLDDAFEAPVPAKRGRPKGYSPKRVIGKAHAAEKPAIGAMSMHAPTERAKPARDEFDADFAAEYGGGNRVPLGDGETRFDVNTRRLPHGWDMQWKTISVMNQPIDPAELMEVEHKGGWKAARAKHFPEDVPPGTDPNACVERGGQRLYLRPMHMTKDANREQQAKAERQKQDRIQGALEGKPQRGGGLSEIKGVRAQPVELVVEGEMGTYSR